jgi:hypothetical protein
MSAAARPSPEWISSYIGLLVTLIVLCLCGERYIFRFVLIVLVDDGIIVTISGKIAGGFGIGGLVAGLQQFWIISLLDDLGRLEGRGRFDGMRFEVRIVGGLGVKFEFWLVLVVAVRASAIVTHRNKY